MWSTCTPMRIGLTFFIILIIKVAAHGGGGAERGDGGREVRTPRTLVGWSNPGALSFCICVTYPYATCGLVAFRLHVAWV